MPAELCDSEGPRPRSSRDGCSPSALGRPSGAGGRPGKPLPTLGVPIGDLRWASLSSSLERTWLKALRKALRAQSRRLGDPARPAASAPSQRGPLPGCRPAGQRRRERARRKEHVERTCSQPFGGLAVGVQKVPVRGAQGVTSSPRSGVCERSGAPRRPVRLVSRVLAQDEVTSEDGLMRSIFSTSPLSLDLLDQLAVSAPALGIGHSSPAGQRGKLELLDGAERIGRDRSAPMPAGVLEGAIDPAAGEWLPFE